MLIHQPRSQKLTWDSFSKIEKLDFIFNFSKTFQKVKHKTIEEPFDTKTHKHIKITSFVRLPSSFHLLPVTFCYCCCCCCWSPGSLPIWNRSAVAAAAVAHKTGPEVPRSDSSRRCCSRYSHRSWSPQRSLLSNLLLRLESSASIRRLGPAGSGTCSWCSSGPAPVCWTGAGVRICRCFGFGCWPWRSMTRTWTVRPGRPGRGEAERFPMRVLLLWWWRHPGRPCRSSVGWGFFGAGIRKFDFFRGCS